MAVIRRSLPWVSQPAGPVEIDWGNPVAQGLASAISAGQDVVQGVPLEPRDLKITPGTDGLGFQAPSGAAFGARLQKHKFTTSDAVTFAGDFTILQLAAPTASSGAQLGLTIGSINGSFRFAGIAYNAAFNLALSPGRFAFYTYQGGFNASNAYINGVFDGQMHLWHIRRDSGKLVAGVDGSNITYGTGHTRPLGQSDNCNLSIAGQERTADLGFIDSSIPLTLCFNRALSDAEIAALSANPWQLFKPRRTSTLISLGSSAPTPVAGIASGAPASLTLSSPAASAAGKARATATPASLSLTAPTATASATPSASPGIATGTPASITLAAPTATAAGKAQATAAPAQITITPAQGSASGKAQATGTPVQITLSAPAATASAGAGSAFGTPASLSLLAPTGTARGAAQAFAAYAGITITAPEAPTATDAIAFAAEIDLTRWYVKRGKKLHIFDRAEDADAFIDAESEAQKAVEQAQKTSRRARKRVRASIAMPQPVQTVDIDQLSGLLRELDMRVDLPALVAQQDFDRVMEVMARAVKAQADRDDELDIEMLLLA